MMAEVVDSAKRGLVGLVKAMANELGRHSAPPDGCGIEPVIGG